MTAVELQGQGGAERQSEHVRTAEPEPADQRRGIKKAKLRFEGGELDLDNVSVNDLELLLRAAKSPPAG